MCWLWRSAPTLGQQGKNVNVSSPPQSHMHLLTTRLIYNQLSQGFPNFALLCIKQDVLLPT